MLGMSHAGSGRYKDAEACFRRLVQLRPQSEAYHYNLGRALELQENYPDAYKYYRLALRHSQHELPQAHNNLGNMYKRDKRYDQEGL